jgi:hypothetical protein
MTSCIVFVGLSIGFSIVVVLVDSIQWDNTVVHERHGTMHLSHIGFENERNGPSEKTI